MSDTDNNQTAGYDAARTHTNMHADMHSSEHESGQPENGERIVHEGQSEFDVMEPAVPPPPPAPSTPGSALRLQREAYGFTIEQVATQLNLAPRQIQALEEDKLSALPGMASARGFIRSYAKLLRIDAEPLIAMLAAHEVSPLIEPVTHRRALSAFDDHRHSVRGLPSAPKKTSIALPALLVLVVALAGAWKMGWLPLVSTMLDKPAASTGSDTVASPSTGTAPNLPESAAPAPLAMTPAEPAPSQSMAVVSPAAPTPAAGKLLLPEVKAEVKPEVKSDIKADVKPAAPELKSPTPGMKSEANVAAPATAVVSPAAPAPSRTAVLPSTANTSAAAPGANKPATAPTTGAASPAAVKAADVKTAEAKPAEAMSVPAANKGALVITVREDSWVDLRRADNAPNGIVVSRVIPAGSTETFDVPEGARLTIGNAKGVQASLRGKAIDINGQSANNVFRQSLK